MTTQQTPPPTTAGFWKVRHLLVGLGVLVLLVMLMVRGCGSDEDGHKEAGQEENLPRQAVVVQIPASQWPQQQVPVQPPAPQQPGYGYIPQQPGYGYAPQQQQQGYGYGYAPQQQQPPPVDSGNPWAVQTPGSYRQPNGAQWGRPQQQPAQQYVPVPSTMPQYRPLDENGGTRVERRPPPPPPAQTYRPAAPYDRLSGSSFGEGSQTPYGAYPGYYGSGAYATPAVPYPGYPGVYPGAGWPGAW